MARLKKGDFASREELEELFGDLAEDESLRVEDLVWALSDNNRDVRSLATKLVLARRLPGTFAAVLKAAVAADGQERRILVRLLPEIPDPNGVEQLAQLLRDRRKTTREMAREAILAFPVDRVLPYVAGFLREDDEDLRYSALSKLDEGVAAGAKLEGRLRALVEQATEDSATRVRLKAFQVLARHPDEAFVDLILERVRTERYSVKKQLIRVLENISLGSDDAKILDSLIPLLGEGDDLIRNAALKIATRAGDPREVVRRIILYSRTLMGWMRDRIHQTISEFGDELLDPIIELLDHEDPDIRSSALLFAVNYSSPKLIRPCVAMLRPEEDWWTRVVAIDALGQLRAEQAVKPLIACLRDPELRWSAVEALTRIGSMAALKPIAKLLGDRSADVRMEVIRALETFNDVRGLPLLERVFKQDPELSVRERAMEAYKKIRTAHDLDVDEKKLRQEMKYTVDSDRRIDRLLNETRKIGASDFHLSPGNPPYVRKDGTMRRLGERAFAPEQSRKLVEEVLPPDKLAVLDEAHQVDLCHEVPGTGRYRANVFRQRRGCGGVFRVIPNEIPTFDQIGLPEHLTDVAHYHQGMVLVTGATGAGKTTTLAALVNLINEQKRAHILTLEDPIEYVHPFKNSLVNQREIGRDSASFPAALRAALREDPDVIVVGEMRDPETMRLAMTAAETGHLVIGTMHTSSADKTVSRLIDSFPAKEQGQIRTMLSESLKAVIHQALVPRADGEGMVACFEVLMVTPAAGHMIRDDKLTMLPSLMTVGRTVGMRTFDDALMELVDKGVVRAEDAWLRARDKERFEELVSPEFLEGVGA